MCVAAMGSSALLRDVSSCWVQPVLIFACDDQIRLVLRLFTPMREPFCTNEESVLLCQMFASKAKFSIFFVSLFSLYVADVFSITAADWLGRLCP